MKGCTNLIVSRIVAEFTQRAVVEVGHVCPSTQEHEGTG